ncbi:MAG: SDR family NAD(P)-dependent oxidoreductase, partial [Nitratireductor sp.]
MNKIDLNGQHAVVTGGAQGLGFAMAKRFVASGATVTLWDIDEAQLQAARDELGNATSTQIVDVADWDSVKTACDRTEDAAGGISI